MSTYMDSVPFNKGHEIVGVGREGIQEGPTGGQVGRASPPDHRTRYVATVSASDPTNRWPFTSTEGMATRRRSDRPAPHGCQRQWPLRQCGETIQPPSPFPCWPVARSFWYSVTSWAQA